MIRPETSKNDIAHYFEYSSQGIEVVQDGLEQVSFGEYLVAERAITRQDLFAALQLQDQNPGVRIGECLAKLGAMGYVEIEKHLGAWNKVSVIDA
jgi:hypothetical protein